MSDSRVLQEMGFIEYFMKVKNISPGFKTTSRGFINCSQGFINISSVFSSRSRGFITSSQRFISGSRVVNEGSLVVHEGSHETVFQLNCLFFEQVQFSYKRLANQSCKASINQ